MKAWKRFEAQVADYFGTKRMPLSGMAEQWEGQDTMHPYLFIECKYRTKLPIWDFWEKERTFFLFEKLIVIHSKDLKELKKLPEKNNNNYCKYKTFVTLYGKVANDAKQVGKIPLIALKKAGKKGFLIITEKTNLMEISQFIKQSVNLEFNPKPNKVKTANEKLGELKELQEGQSPQLVKIVAQTLEKTLTKELNYTDLERYILENPQETIRELEKLVIKGNLKLFDFKIIFSIFKTFSQVKTKLIF